MNATTSAVAIGVFDGLHLGHQAILERAMARARERSGRCVVVSFDPHPDVILNPSELRFPAPLTPPQEKRDRLLRMGVDELAVLPFTRELAALAPEDFVDRHLLPAFHPHALVVGEGFALGRGRAGTVDRLQGIGQSRDFVVEEVRLRLLDGAAVSSTRIRELLSRGDVTAAARLLGRDYALEGRVVRGHGIGRTLGFPTANLRLHEEKLLPADGIYVARARIGTDREWRPAAMSIGMRPTFDGRERELEVHVLGWSRDLLGVDLAVELVDWLRPEVRFESPENLVAAMGQDVAEVRRRLSVPAEPKPGS